MQPTINTTLTPKAYRCLKQAHRRRIEDTPLTYPTQTRLNACQLQVCMTYSVQQQTQCTTHSASCRSRPAGLVTLFTRSFGLAHLDLYCWRRSLSAAASHDHFPHASDCAATVTTTLATVICPATNPDNNFASCLFLTRILKFKGFY